MLLVLFIEAEQVTDTAYQLAAKAKRIYLVDSGLLFNSPYPPLLRPERDVDIFLSFDFSAREKDNEISFHVINWISFVDQILNFDQHFAPMNFKILCVSVLNSWVKKVLRQQVQFRLTHISLFRNCIWQSNGQEQTIWSSHQSTPRNSWKRTESKSITCSQIPRILPVQLWCIFLSSTKPSKNKANQVLSEIGLIFLFVNEWFVIRFEHFLFFCLLPPISSGHELRLRWFVVVDRVEIISSTLEASFEHERSLSWSIHEIKNVGKTLPWLTSCVPEQINGNC